MQTILMGMGELHLEVIKERLRSEYKLDVTLGPLIISYREMLENKVTESAVFDKVIGKLSISHSPQNYTQYMY